MQRTYRKADYERDKAAAQAKYEKNYAGTGVQPVQTRSVAAGAAAYREDERIRQRDAAEKVERAERKLAEEEAFIRQVEAAQDVPGAITPAEIYATGLASRDSRDGIEAATYFWQALVCGEKRAAFDLFEMLRDGESGVGKNMEMSGMFFYFASRCMDAKCKTTTRPAEMNFDAAKAIFAIYAKSRDLIARPGYSVTPELIAERQAAANEVLDLFSDTGALRTRAYEEPMVAVFAHDDIEDDAIVVVGASGDAGGASGGGSGGCCCMM